MAVEIIRCLVRVALGRLEIEGPSVRSNPFRQAACSHPEGILRHHEKGVFDGSEAQTLAWQATHDGALLVGAKPGAPGGAAIGGDGTALVGTGGRCGLILLHMS